MLCFAGRDKVQSMHMQFSWNRDDVFSP